MDIFGGKLTRIYRSTSCDDKQVRETNSIAATREENFGLMNMLKTMLGGYKFNEKIGIFFFLKKINDEDEIGLTWENFNS